MSVEIRGWFLRLSAIGTGIVACFAVYYGATMSFLAPGNVGESFFVRERVLYGLLPFGSGVLFAVVALMLWKAGRRNYGG